VRNRARIVETARAVFAARGADASLEEIARGAGVGIGTLYRHFPTRDALIEAVYRRELEGFAEAGDRLSETLPPGQALHAWMHLLVDYIATKKVIAAAVATMVSDSADLYASSGTRITDAMNSMIVRAAQAGDIRGDVDPDDLLRALVGFSYGNASPGWEASAKRLIDILMDGLRPQPGA
jgi:AcrR family transcriptional regulator